MRKYAQFSIIVVALAALASNCSALPMFRTVALTGQPAPGMPNNALFEELVTSGPEYYVEPQIDDQGRVAFSATFPSLWSEFPYGYWSEATGSLEIVVGSGAPPADAPAGTENFDLFPYAVLDHAGNSYFWSMSFGPGLDQSNNVGFWAGQAGSVSRVLHGGLPAPGLPAGVNFRDGTSSPLTAVSGDGTIAVHGYLQGSGVDSTNAEAIWVGRPDSLELLARTGEQAPGTDPGHLFAVLEPTIRINSTGETAFVAAVTNPGTGPVWKQGVWAYRDDSTSLVALTGEEAPGVAGGVVFQAIDYEVAISNSGHVAFKAHVSGPGATDDNREGLWYETPTGLQLLARDGSPAPGTAAGTVFGESTFNSLAHDVAGNVIFAASLVGGDADATNSSGVWRSKGDSLELILRRGDEAPGTEPGTYFNSAPVPAMNALGQMAFFAGLRGNSVDQDNNAGIWASDLDGLLHLIVRKGDLLEVGPSDFRTIADLYMLTMPGYSDAFRGFNNKGQLVFRATFTDGTWGVFVSNRVAVPEPSVAVLVVLGLAAWACPRHGLKPKPIPHR